MLLVFLVSNNLLNYGRKDFKLFTNCQVSSLVGHPVFTKPSDLSYSELRKENSSHITMMRNILRLFLNLDCLQFSNLNNPFNYSDKKIFGAIFNLTCLR